MAETQRPRPHLVEARALQTLDAVRQVTGGGFDVDAWHVMEERDNALIADEILHGAGSSKFVYVIEEMKDAEGKPVSGISVIGARHLANHYGGLQHRIVASMQKTGSLFTFTSYPAENIPMTVTTAILQELEEEDDFFAAVCEMKDIKTGNSIQIERREKRYERRRSGGEYERPNYATIAQSKAYRNAVLALIPQDVAIRWKAQMLKLGKGETITASVLDEKRAHVIRFAAQRAIGLDRHAVEGLTLDQISGLGDAAREGRLPAFVDAAKALGLDIETGSPPEPQGRTAPPATQEGTATSGPQRRGRRAAAASPPSGSGDPAPTTGENPPAGDPQANAPGAPGRPRVNFEV
jgi:hypothetical protein